MYRFIFIFSLLIVSNFSFAESLLRTAMQGDTEALNQILIKGENVNTPDCGGRTALHWGVWSENADTVQILLQQQALVNAQDLEGVSPLHWAAERGHLEILRLLLDHEANIDIRDLEGRTPLYWAVTNRQAEAVKFLLFMGADYEGLEEMITEFIGISPRMFVLALAVLPRPRNSIGINFHRHGVLFPQLLLTRMASFELRHNSFYLFSKKSN